MFPAFSAEVHACPATQRRLRPKIRYFLWFGSGNLHQTQSTGKCKQRPRSDLSAERSADWNGALSFTYSNFSHKPAASISWQVTGFVWKYVFLFLEDSYILCHLVQGAFTRPNLQVKETFLAFVNPSKAPIESFFLIVLCKTLYLKENTHLEYHQKYPKLAQGRNSTFIPWGKKI